MNKPAMSAMRKQAQSGFTLIELIVVIVILGILAATALPKFASLGGDARSAALRAAQGSLAATVSMVHGQALMRPGTTAFTNEGVTVTTVNGYPSAAQTTLDAAGLGASDYAFNISATVNGGDATHPPVPANGFTIVPLGVANTAISLTCYISYAESTAANVAPVISIVNSNCGN